jgi:glutathione synthase/RimK-type ligase-like ATP-grasp enzyme
MTITYSRCSTPSARTIAGAGGFRLNRGPTGDINWGRATANTKLNPDISKTTNKRHMRVLFKQHNVPMPELYANVAEIEFPCVGRPDRHSGRRGLWVCRNLHDLRRAIRGTRKKQAATHFMAYIEAPREYRVHIFRGKSIRISQKSFGTTGETAHGIYTTVKPDPSHPINHVRKAAKQAVAAVGLDFGAVDILADDEDCWVLEVNAAPGLGGSLPRLYSEAFNKYLEEN